MEEHLEAPARTVQHLVCAAEHFGAGVLWSSALCSHCQSAGCEGPLQAVNAVETARSVMASVLSPATTKLASLRACFPEVTSVQEQLLVELPLLRLAAPRSNK